MMHILIHLRWLLIIPAAILASAAPARALDIRFNFSNDFDNRPLAVAGMERAAAMWEAVLADPVEVTIDLRVVPLFELGFAQAATFRTPQIPSYADLRHALVADATSALDATAVAHLPAGERIVFRTWDPEGNVIVNDGADGINGYFDVFSANAKALGLGLEIDSEPGTVDAEIWWNEGFFDLGVLDLDRTDGIAGTDFISVAAHEVGHALGFASGVDDVDESSLPGGPYAPENLNEFAILNPPDLFRYTAESLPNIDLAPGGQPYFSIDGGVTALAPFATGIFNGNGDQAGHWAGGGGIMDARLPDNTAVTISPLDLQMMDVIGSDIVPPGDTNADGLVNVDDLNNVRNHFGDMGVNDGTLAGDAFSFDGKVNIDDLNGVRNNFGASAQPVPEPSALALALLLGLVSLVVRPRRHV